MANSFEPQLPNRNTVDIPADKSVDFKKQIAEESTNNINAADSFWENEIFDKYNNLLHYCATLSRKLKTSPLAVRESARSCLAPFLARIR